MIELLKLRMFVDTKYTHDLFLKKGFPYLRHRDFMVSSECTV